jgi:hypothetical protein
MALSDRRCQSCGTTLPDEAAGHPASAVEPTPPSQHVGEFELVPKRPGSLAPLEPIAPAANIRRSDQGETLAVLALLLPLVAQSLALACHFDSVGIAMALGWGTIVVTALLLAVDAGFLGTVDLQGTQRCSPVALFFGMLLFWIIGYPVAFFRRRHFGRPNLGPLALLVAGFFVAAPFVQQYIAFGVVGGAPTCTSREVIAMVDDLIRKSPVGPSVLSISGHREISYDRASQTRKGQCLVQTQAETITAKYSVKMINRANGTFQVEVEPIIPADPPACTDPEVIALVKRLIGDEPIGRLLKTVTEHEEIRYDREKKTRHGRCLAVFQGMGGGTEKIAYRYKVYWWEHKTGQFQVEIEP